MGKMGEKEKERRDCKKMGEIENSHDNSLISVK